MKKSILLVGPQGSGKTTRAKAIINGRPYIHQHGHISSAFPDGTQVIFFDEMDIADKQVQTLLKKLVGSKKVLQPEIIVASQCENKDIPAFFRSKNWTILTCYRRPQQA